MNIKFREMAHYYYVWKWPRKWLGRPMSPGGQCRGGQCHLEANVFFQKEANVGEVNVGEANVIAPFQVHQLTSTMGIWNPDNSKFWMVEKRSVCKCLDFKRELKFGNPTIQNKRPPFCQKIFEIQKKCPATIVPVFKCPGYNPTLWSQEHLK